MFLTVLEIFLYSIHWNYNRGEFYCLCKLIHIQLVPFVGIRYEKLCVTKHKIYISNHPDFLKSLWIFQDCVIFLFVSCVLLSSRFRSNSLSL